MTRTSDSHHEMTTFVTVVQAGSFAQGAILIGQTPSAVSKTISRLEKRLNVKLFNRSTRSVRTTEAGERYYNHCKQILSDIDKAEEDVSQFSSEPCGTLNVNCGAGFALHHVVDIISQFLKSYPKITINLSTAKNTNFFEDEIDVSFEFKAPEDSSLIARKIHSCPWSICATPAYLKKHGTPKKPEDLKYHNCCIMIGEEVYDNWKFIEGDHRYAVKVDGNFHSSGFLVLKAVVNDVGIAQLPHYMVSEHIRSGKLSALFSDKRPNNKREIYLAFPHRTQLPVKVRVFVDFVMEHLPKRISPENER